jgi:uncharacterized membrane protein
MGAWQEWLDLGLRWLHVTAGVAWIGASFYFMWLDSHLKPAPEMRKGAAGELWSVHGGGFYHKTKFLVAPEGMPQDLHWFKWESYVTWISGFLLLGLVFYVGADINLIDQTKADLGRWQAIGLGLGSLAAGWLVYDGLCRSPLGARPALFGAVWFLLLTGAAWALTQVFSDRAAFMHVGAIIGTAMTGNVFLIIIPNQRKVVAQLLAGQAPDPNLGKQAKQRSVHNNYMTLPVLFIMVSNHYPMIYASPLNWLWLAALGLTGWSIRRFFNIRNSGALRWEWWGYAALPLIAAAGINAMVTPKTQAASDFTFAQVRTIVNRHCISCHAAAPTFPGLDVAPNGALFDTDAGLKSHAAKIHAQTVATENMPVGNMTGMTSGERAILGAWIEAGAPLDR